MKKFLVFSAVALFLAVGAGIAALVSISSNLPQMISVEDYKPLLVTEVYARDGEKIGEFFRERRILTPYEKIPKHLIEAFVSAEDDTFFEHHGINFVAIFRALLANIQAGRKVQGASTITQQLTKTLLLSPEKTYTRKIREAILAYRMESHLTKEEILYLYLNQIYFGQGAYGVGMAAQTYFRKPVENLNLAEMAMLAGLPKAPSRFSPVYNPKRAKERQLYVLKRMAEEEYIESDVAQAAGQQNVKVYFRENFNETAPYYLETVRQLLVSDLGEKSVLDDGLKVYTGLDFEKQKVAQESLRRGLRQVDKRQGFRGPLKNLASEEEVLKFLQETREKLVDKMTPYRIVLPDGTNPEVPVWQTEVASSENPGELKAVKIPFYLKVNDFVEGVVTDVNDRWGYVAVRFAEGQGLIDFETMKWAREPNPDVRFDQDQIEKPSEALKKGDVIQVRILRENFRSRTITKAYNELKSQYSGRDFERPEDLPLFDEWAHLVLEQEPRVESALISFDQETSEVLALVGGYDFSRSEFNRALQSARQTGSSFKAIVYAAGLDRHYTPVTKIIDAPIVYEEEIEEFEGDSLEEEKTVRKWKPTNHSKRFGGDILFRNALIRSLNVPTVKIVQKLGIPWVAEYARRLGIFSPLNMDYTIGLGSSGVTLYELTKVFSTFGRLGRRIRPLLIHQVHSRQGALLLEKISLDRRFSQEIADNESYFDERRKLALEELEQINADDSGKKRSSYPPLYFEDHDQLMKPTTAYLITSLLEGTVHERRGTGGAARALGRRVAAKTGSTSGYYDGWFIGYTPQISTGVWVGFDQEQTIGKSEVGGRNALPIWLNYMKEAHEGLPEKSFAVPSDIIFANIDNETGQLASVRTKDYVRQAFLEGTEPQTSSREEEDNDETDFLKQDLE